MIHSRRWSEITVHIGFSLLALVLIATQTVFGESRAAVQKAMPGRPATTGFLIVDGRYVSPPYTFRSGPDGFFVRDTRLDVASLGLAESDFWKWQMVPPDHQEQAADPVEVKFRKTAIRPQFPFRNIAPRLGSGDIVIVTAGQPPRSLFRGDAGYELLKLLLDDERRTQLKIDDLAGFGRQGRIDVAAWHRWITEFQVSDEFRSRAGAAVQRVEDVLAKNIADVQANDRLQSSSYPLTVIGMLLVVAAVGHLLSYRPPATDVRVSHPLPTEENRAVIVGLLLVVLLSALDLVWTLLAHQAGAMKELNPLGARLIDDADRLILFKLIATVIGAGLLFVTRRFVLARRATWWCCLVCTLLAARWIGINSVFV